MNANGMYCAMILGMIGLMTIVDSAELAEDPPPLIDIHDPIPASSEIEAEGVFPFPDNEVKTFLGKIESDYVSYYFQLFVNNGFDTMDLVKTLTNEKLKNDIGIPNKGHRRRILKECQNLSQFDDAKSVPKENSSTLPTRLGRNHQGMPIALANALVLIISTTKPEIEHWGGESSSYANAITAWHRINRGCSDNRCLHWRANFRRKHLRAEELGIFDQIELRKTDQRIAVLGRLRNGFKFDKRTENGFYLRPDSEQKDIPPFRLQDQWTMTQQFLIENGWTLNKDYCQDDASIMVFEHNLVRKGKMADSFEQNQK